MNPQPPLSQIPNPSAPPQARQVCPRFELRRMEYDLWLDGAVNWSVFVGMLLLVLVLSQSGQEKNWLVWILFLAVIGWAIANSFRSARVMPLLPQIAGWIEMDPAAAEAAIASSLAIRPLPRQVRIQLYHRLALLRHYQMRFDESTAIAQALLSRPLGRAERYRPQLLLVLTEARLLQNDLAGAYPALVELARRKLALIESLQHLSLRTRYEVGAGYDGMALTSLPAKIEMAQMMPADQCGSMHAMLAIAAMRQGDQTLHDWLYRRAELMCEPGQFEQFRQGRLRFGVERSLTMAAV